MKRTTVLNPGLEAKYDSTMNLIKSIAPTYHLKLQHRILLIMNVKFSLAEGIQG